jgi:predicted MFS family arabinose efflux permease
MTIAELTRSGLAAGRLPRLAVVAAISFLTLVDLFATQAILPSLALAYGVTPAAMGAAVNLCTLGMAVAGLAVAFLGHRIDRRAGVALSLALLSLPTALLALMPDLGLFAALRLAQGVFMSAAFTLTIAYLAETAEPDEVAGLLAAYVTGNVASNLFGRLLSAGVADHFGLSANFGVFAALNLAGAALAFIALRDMPSRSAAKAMMGGASWRAALAKPHLRSSYGIGFLILFCFIGAFTYVNFVLASPPVALSPMRIGLVYLVFIPSILLTPMAGRAARRFGAPRVVAASLGVSAAALPALLADDVAWIMAGLAVVAAGTFFAQATATGHVSRTSGEARGAAGGMYLSAYYSGGLVGSLVLGWLFDGLGWGATVAAIGAALIAGAALAKRLDEGR